MRDRQCDLPEINYGNACDITIPTIPDCAVVVSYGFNKIDHGTVCLSTFELLTYIR